MTTTPAASSGGGGGGTKSTQLGGTLNGAGATFPQPVYQEWAARFKDKVGTTVNYQGIGSGGGIAQFTAGTVDFGATDSAMKDEEVAAAKAKGDPVHVPTVLGAVTVSYNLDGVKSGLKLDGATIADIFLGKIKTWNDPKIAGGNPDFKLPSSPITICHRSDESGTTKNFLTFLAAYSPAWAKGPGVDKSVKWPTGTGAKGNDGVAACIKQNAGAVGYVEQAYALANNFTFASVKNKSGDFIAPTLDSTSAAGDGLKLPEDLRVSTIDAPSKTAYPIAALTFLLVYAGPVQGRHVAGQGEAASRRGSTTAWATARPWPASCSTRSSRPRCCTKAQAKVDGLTCNGKAIAGT